MLTKSNGEQSPPGPWPWAFLDQEQIKQIDRALADVGSFGEVRLVKAKGKLRFIQKLESEEVLTSSPFSSTVPLRSSA